MNMGCEAGDPLLIALREQVSVWLEPLMSQVVVERGCCRLSFVFGRGEAIDEFARYGIPGVLVDQGAVLVEDDELPVEGSQRSSPVTVRNCEIVSSRSSEFRGPSTGSGAW